MSPIPTPRFQQIYDCLFTLPKVKLPTFEGTNARAWVSKTEPYFLVHHTPTDQKLKLSQICMDGSALRTTLVYQGECCPWWRVFCRIKSTGIVSLPISSNVWLSDCRSLISLFTLANSRRGFHQFASTLAGDKRVPNSFSHYLSFSMIFLLPNTPIPVIHTNSYFYLKKALRNNVFDTK